MEERWVQISAEAPSVRTAEAVDAFGEWVVVAEAGRRTSHRDVRRQEVGQEGGNWRTVTKVLSTLEQNGREKVDQDEYSAPVAASLCNRKRTTSWL